MIAYSASYSLSLVLRGEGWGEGTYAANIKRCRLCNALSPHPTLSPAYRGEGSTETHLLFVGRGGRVHPPYNCASFVGWAYSPTICGALWASAPTLQLCKQSSDNPAEP